MGYRPPRKIYNLDFTGTDYEGLQVALRGFTVGEELDLDDKDMTGPLIVETLVARLVSWNVEDDQGQPVPATHEGVRSQDSVMIGAIISALREATSGVPAPLPETSPSGETSPAPPIPMPMAPLSENHQSSAVPA